jgi:hypothetical protein
MMATFMKHSSQALLLLSLVLLACSVAPARIISGNHQIKSNQINSSLWKLDRVPKFDGWFINSSDFIHCYDILYFLEDIINCLMYDLQGKGLAAWMATRQPLGQATTPPPSVSKTETRLMDPLFSAVRFWMCASRRRHFARRIACEDY